MRAKTKKNWLLVGAGMLAGAFALTGGLALNVARTTALAEETGKIFYYVDAGNLVANENGTGSLQGRDDVGYPCTVQTLYMQTYGLTFGTEESVGNGTHNALYNSVTDKVYGADEKRAKSGVIRITNMRTGIAKAPQVLRNLGLNLPVISMILLNRGKVR